LHHQLLATRVGLSSDLWHGQLLYVDADRSSGALAVFLRFAPVQCVGPRERNGPRLSLPIPSQEAEEL